jgi:hypothetical protein
MKKISIITVMAAMTILFAITASAMDFNVTIEEPDNQRHPGASLFDLVVNPGQEQDLLIIISNTSQREITVSVETVTASTGRNGAINYSSAGLMDETLQYSFEDLARPPQSHYTIPAQDSIRVPIRLNTPQEPFDGIILGSIVVLREATQEERDESGSIVNQFAQVIQVRLRNSEEAADIPTHFELEGIFSEPESFRVSITANLRNIQPKMLREASVSAIVYPEGSDQPIYESYVLTVDFAPNSIFQYTFIYSEGIRMDAGNYTAIITIESEGEIWELWGDFVVTPDEASIFHEGSHIEQVQQRPESSISDVASDFLNLPLWAYIALAVNAILLIIIIVVIIRIVTRKSDKKEKIKKLKIKR